jgi:bifunctional oligoribonuclease and PAP phosphatase NrnA
VQSPFDILKTYINSSSRFVLTTHVNPDGDGLGSEIALALYLKSKGKEVSIMNSSATPDNYLFLLQLHSILFYDPSIHAKSIEEADVLIVLDANHPDRLGSMKSSVLKSRAKKVCIDHHPESGAFADLYILDERSPATGEIIFNFLSQEGYTINHEIARALYVALMTDTGSFRYQKTDSEVHTITAQLLKAGADPAALYELIYEQNTLNRMQLLGMALENLQTMYDGKLAYMIITRTMFESTSTTEEDTDAFVPYTLAVENVQIGLMFSELDGVVKVNFRSKGPIPINELAKEFGGNGHTNASGARIAGGSLNKIVQQVLKHAGKYIRSIE